VYDEAVNILFVVAEMAPLVKVGGVGDIGGSLPRALRRLGQDVRVALPLYKTIDRAAVRAERVASLPDGAALWKGEHDGLQLYLVEHNAFERENVYGYDDEAERFLAFCTGVVDAADAIDWPPDVIHLNDWLTGFVGTRLVGKLDHPWRDVPQVFTIHNLGYRGDFLKPFARAHDLPKDAFKAPRGVSRHVPYSGLAQGLLHARIVSAVSPTYAREILEPEHGGALAPLVRTLGDRLEGILNGIDTDEYDPARDPHLAVNYDVDSLEQRAANKAVLQQKMGLPASGAPLIGMVTRLFEQKAPDLAAAAIAKLASETEFQFVVLGTGAPEHEQQLSDLAAKHPDRIAVRLAFDYALGQQIYGGSDMFLMPSRYEPCGLGQMIAMRYGAVPIVRRTGGLADSVAPYDAANERGTGFLFDDLSADALAAAVREAIGAFDDKLSWRKLQLRGMTSDFSWDNAARRYVELYERSRMGVAK
jgi:starch synthase